jgi:polyhydroxyalkanoate synthesis regulator phasin
MARKPLWRQAVDEVDRRISRPVEAGTRSDAFLDALALGWRLRGRLQREAERQSRRALHMLNLPTASDVRRLSEQVGALQRQVRELSREVEK